jgi:Ca2+-binding EF-hand superfamily protein
MMPQVIAVLLGLVAVVVIGETARAQDGGGAAAFQHLDLNGDGMIDADELAALRSRVFNSMDRDLDGNLTENEFVELWLDEVAPTDDPRRADLRRARQQRFAEMDVDGDGTVSKQSYIEIGTERLMAADTDKDGKLSPAEFAAENRD